MLFSNINTKQLLAFIFAYSFCFQGISQTAKSPTVNIIEDEHTGRIIGTVKSDATNDVVALANVFLYSAKDSTLIKGMVTDEKGQYNFNELKPGNYTISVECKGHQNRIIKDVKIEKKRKKLKEVLLSITDEVRAKAKKESKYVNELIEEGKSLSVHKNIFKKGDTVEDVFRKIPNIHLDEEGKITIKGCSKVLLLLNGMPIMQESTAYLPKDINPKDIKRIEVCTNSSDKNAPTGITSIIDIIAKKKGKKKSTVAAKLELGNSNHIDAFVDYNYTIKKFLISTSYSFRHGKVEQNDYFKKTSLQTDNLLQINQNNTKNLQYSNHYFTRTIGFKPNDKNTLSGSLIYSFKFLKNNANTTTDYLIDDILTQESFRTERSKQSRKAVGLDFSYLKTFDRKERYLNFYASYSLAGEKDEQDYEDDFFDAQQVPLFQEEENSFSKAVNNNWYFELDYVHPLHKNKTITFKLRSNLRKIDNEFSFSEYCFNLSDWQIDEQISNSLVYKDQDYIGEFMFSDDLKKFSYKLGFGAQQVRSNSDVVLNDQFFEHNFLKVFPRAQLNYSFSSNKQLQFRFDQLANRPQYSYLNPFNDFDNPYVISMGNLALQSEYQTRSNLSFTQSWANGSVSSSLFYDHINNPITPFFTEEEDILIQTWQNLNARSSFGFEMRANLLANKFWELSSSISLAQIDIDGRNINQRLSNSGTVLSSQLKQVFRFPKLVDIELNGFYQSQQISAQGTFGENYFMDIALRRSIFKGKGTLSFRVTDVFNSKQRLINIANENLEYEYKSKWTSRFALLGITYALNHKTTPSFKDPIFGHSIYVIENTTSSNIVND